MSATSRAAPIPARPPSAPPATARISALRKRISTITSASATANPASAAVQRENPNGCQAAANAPRHTRNAARPIQTVPALPYARTSELFLDDATERAEVGSKELAPSVFVRLIRPHRILKSLQNRTANASGPGAAAPRLHASYLHSLYIPSRFAASRKDRMNESSRCRVNFA